MKQLFEELGLSLRAFFLLPPERSPQLRSQILSLKGQEVSQLTLGHIVEKVETYAPEEVALELLELEKEGRVQRKIRVESPTITRGGLGDFTSLDKVPDTIPDRDGITKIPVTPDRLKVIYFV